MRLALALLLALALALAVPVFASVPQQCDGVYRGDGATPFLIYTEAPGGDFVARYHARVIQRSGDKCSKYDLYINVTYSQSPPKTRVDIYTPTGDYVYEHNGVAKVYVVLRRSGGAIVIGSIYFVDPDTGGVLRSAHASILLCSTTSCKVLPFLTQGVISLYGMWQACGDPDFECDAELASGRDCAWWDIMCHLVNFLNWLGEQIMKLLPQPIRDLVEFLGMLFGFLGELVTQLVKMFPYFLMTIAILLSVGLVYYIVEYGVAGVGMYFMMLYSMLRKFIDLFIKILDLIIPF